MAKRHLVLIIEDHPHTRRSISTLVESQGYRTIEASSGAQGVQLAKVENPDVVLLDLRLPDTTGREVTQKLREWSQTPIIVISVSDDTHDIVELLDLGADDYIIKPFEPDELLARIRVSLRHALRQSTQAEISKPQKLGDLAINFDEGRVYKCGAEVDLTNMEFRVLQTMVLHRERVLSHERILEEVWGPLAKDHKHYVRIYIHRLRKKLEDDPESPRYIVTETGAGYRFKPANGEATMEGLEPEAATQVV